MADDKNLEPEILANDEGFKELMGLFKEKNFFQRLKTIAVGLSKPADSKEYKEARTNLQRLMAPAMAVIIPCILVVLLLIFGKSKAKQEVAVEVNVEQEEEIQEELEEFEEPEPPETMDDIQPS